MPKHIRNVQHAVQVLPSLEGNVSSVLKTMVAKGRYATIVIRTWPVGKVDCARDAIYCRKVNQKSLDGFGL